MGTNRNVSKRACVCEDFQTPLGFDFTNRSCNPRPLKKHRFYEDLKPNLFDALSEDLLFLILDRLDSNDIDRKSFSLVCRSFYAAESRHRRTLRPLQSDLIPALLYRYLSITHLDLSFCPRVSDDVLASIAAGVRPSLLSIDLSRSSSLSHFGLGSLTTSCMSLVEINLSNVIALSDASAAAIGRARNLERLWLARCKLVTDMGIGCIAVGCRKLKLLCLKWCLGLTDLGIGLVAVKCRDLRDLDLSNTMITKNCLPAIFQLPHLEKLSLVGCYGLDDDGLVALKQSCKSLEVFDMSNSQHVSDVGLSSIVNGAVNLRQLILAYSSPVTHRLASSLTNLAKLETIKLDGCQITSSGLLALGSSCNSLKVLSLSKCLGVTDEGLSSVVAKHRGLTKLDITCCRMITDISIASITSSCTSLKSLRMESCNLVSKNGFRMIGEHCPLLEELDLTDNDLDNEGLKAISRCHKLLILKIGLCLNANDEGIIQIGRGCLLLKELDLYRTVGITDAGIMAIGRGCPKLQMINLAYCTEITDNALRSLSKCSKLSTLELRGCSQVSNYGLVSIALGCKDIVKLDIKKCYDITDIGIVPFAHLCSRLRQINLSYSSVTAIGLLALASIKSLQSVTILHLNELTPDGLATMLLASVGLKRVKLHISFKYLISGQVIRHLEARGCIFQWRDKPFQAEVDANEVWKQMSQDLVAVV
ncbi:F-box/LRR-repeat protein 3 [Phalaenopsis equestris]|uniref:F-box/LRR-repeat protein 3 n=1 Tax=Phalaenopsis equestris TaxID=78828 RepID=UPI0009E56D4E|nr:F-box/LRR-repeat protein 3 [Phalaenopsis equestris]